MKTILKYLVSTGIAMLLFLTLRIPAEAQRGGGGGHSGGGGGGHSGGGGGSHFGGGGGFHFSGSVPRGTTVRSGFARSNTTGVRGNGRSVGVTAHRGYMPGNSPGVYGHGGKPGKYKWHRHGGYFYNHGYYGIGYYPMLGFSCSVLDGYQMFYWDDDPYYFSDGLYYHYDNDQYTVIEPPIGAEIDSLPPKAQPVVINGQRYYELDGVYYLPFFKSNGKQGYRIAGKDGELNTGANGETSITPKVGDMVKKLPRDCRKIKIGSDVLYVSADGIYYQETKDANRNKAYVIVGIEEEN